MAFRVGVAINGTCEAGANIAVRELVTAEAARGAAVSTPFGGAGQRTPS